MIVRRVGTAPPNILSIKACIASICILLLPFLLLLPAAFIANIIASVKADALFLLFTDASSASSTFSSTEIASYRHFAISNRPTTEPVLSRTGRCLKRLSTIISRASNAESSSCTHFGFFVITESTQVISGSMY